jgi:ribosomal protein L22
MSPDKPTDEQEPNGEGQAKPAAKAKPAVAKRAAAKPVSKKPAVKEGEVAATEEKPATSSTAKKQAQKKPTAVRAGSPEAEKTGGGKAEKARGPKAEKAGRPETEKPSANAVGAEKAAGTKAEESGKPAAVADRDAPSAAASRARRKVVRAQARYVRTSARKARMVCGHLRGKSVVEARAILAFTPREVARDWSKLLESAVANAENNHELVEDDLLVREAYADEGPTIKRFRPRAQGRATPIRKRTSHLTITLTPKP